MTGTLHLIQDLPGHTGSFPGHTNPNILPKSGFRRKATMQFQAAQSILPWSRDKSAAG